MLTINHIYKFILLKIIFQLKISYDILETFHIAKN